MIFFTHWMCYRHCLIHLQICSFQILIEFLKRGGLKHYIHVHTENIQYTCTCTSFRNSVNLSPNLHHTSLIVVCSNSCSDKLHSMVFITKQNASSCFLVSTLDTPTFKVITVIIRPHSDRSWLYEYTVHYTCIIHKKYITHKNNPKTLVLWFN